MHYYRLKKQSDFDKLFKKGKRAFSSSLTVVYRPADKLIMGISVGKRHGKSVQRNRIKRLIREAFRAAKENLKGKYAVVLIPKVRDTYDFHTFKADLECIIGKENL